MDTILNHLHIVHLYLSISTVTCSSLTCSQSCVGSVSSSLIFITESEHNSVKHQGPKNIWFILQLIWFGPDCEAAALWLRAKAWWETSSQEIHLETCSLSSDIVHSSAKCKVLILRVLDLWDRIYSIISVWAGGSFWETLYSNCMMRNYRSSETRFIYNVGTEKTELPESNMNVHHLPVQYDISVSDWSLFLPLCLSSHDSEIMYFSHFLFAFEVNVLMLQHLMRPRWKKSPLIFSFFLFLSLFPSSIFFHTSACFLLFGRGFSPAAITATSSCSPMRMRRNSELNSSQYVQYASQCSSLWIQNNHLSCSVFSPLY